MCIGDSTANHARTGGGLSRSNSNLSFYSFNLLLLRKFPSIVYKRAKKEYHTRDRDLHAKGLITSPPIVS